MMKIIDADELLEKIKEISHYDDYDVLVVDWDDMIICLDNAPTIDAEPVVRCKNCRYGREVCGNIECSVDRNLPPEYHGYEWFCPNGERRTNEVN